jgi:hypothetical protein
MAVGRVGQVKPGTPGPGGFVPWSAGMSLPALYSNMSGVERMQAILGQAFQDYLGAQPLNMALMGRSGVSSPRAQGIGGMNLQSRGPQVQADPNVDLLAENRLQSDMWGQLMDAYQRQSVLATQVSPMERLASSGLLSLAGMAIGGGVGGVAGAGVGTSAGGLLGSILGGRY